MELVQVKRYRPHTPRHLTVILGVVFLVLITRNVMTGVRVWTQKWRGEYDYLIICVCLYLNITESNQLFYTCILSMELMVMLFLLVKYRLLFVVFVVVSLVVIFDICVFTSCNICRQMHLSTSVNNCDKFTNDIDIIVPEDTHVFWSKRPTSFVADFENDQFSSSVAVVSGNGNTIELAPIVDCSAVHNVV